MQINTLTSPTNQSYSIIDPNINRLNASSQATTPENNSDVRGILLQFEQFQNKNEMQTTRTKKQNQLSIRIDQNYNCKLKDAPGIRNIKKNKQKPQIIISTVQDSLNYFSKETSRQSESQKNIIIQYRQKIDQLSTKIISLQQKLHYYEDYNRKYKIQNQQLRNQREDFLMKQCHLKQVITKKDEIINSEKQMIQELQNNIKCLQQRIIQGHKFDQKLKQRDSKIKELIKKLQKVIYINKGFEKELKQSNNKIIQLQKQMQLQDTHKILQNRLRIKESVSLLNKQNVQQCNFRKSVEQTKKIEQDKKTKISNNTMHNIQKKTKSISNIHKIKHN